MTRVSGWLGTGLIGLLALGCAAETPTPEPEDDAGRGARAPAVTDSLLRLGHRGSPGHWPTYGGDLAQTRFSPLDQIDAGNVAGLRPAWIYQAGVGGTYEVTPLVAGRAMYLTTPMRDGEQRVARLDATTGREVWRTTLRPDTGETGQQHDAHLPEDFSPNRGVALYGDRVYLGTGYGTLAALDAETGDIDWEVSTGAPRLTGAPAAFGGTVVIGLSFTDRGAVEAYDAETGTFEWRWWAIPSPEQGGWWGEWRTTLPGRPSVSLGRDTARERADSARHADAWESGGGAAPMTPAVDPDLGLVYVSTGGPSPHGFPADATPPPGDYRWTNSVCALRIRDGGAEWCRQVLPHDVWGASGPTPPMLFEAETDAGEPVPAIARFTGMGLLYVWDRRTGELLRVSDNYIPADEREVEDPEQPNLVPNLLAGTVWSPGAFSPATGRAYSANRYWPGYFDPDTRAGPDRRRGNVAAVDVTTGSVPWRAKTDEPMASGVLATAGDLVFAGQSTGTFDAWEARSGEHLWQYRAGAGCNAAPITYEVDGTQYVAVACGGHSMFGPAQGSAILAFSLPDR